MRASNFTTRVKNGNSLYIHPPVHFTSIHQFTLHPPTSSLYIHPPVHFTSIHQFTLHPSTSSLYIHPPVHFTSIHQFTLHPSTSSLYIHPPIVSNEVWALLTYYATYSDNSLRTFRNKVSHMFTVPEYGTNMMSRNVDKKLPLYCT